jgi:transcriptional regulator with XRE-family HTH domain
MEDAMPQDTTGDHSVDQGASPDLPDAIFARRLRTVRQSAGLTQLQLADRMSAAGDKMHRSAIAKIESGDRVVSVGEAVQIAGVLGVDLVELVTDPAGQDEAHRRRVEAQAEVRSRQHLAAERRRLLEEQQVLYDNAVDRLQAAERRLAELGGELPHALTASSAHTAFEQTLAAASRPLAPGKDDQ